MQVWTLHSQLLLSIEDNDLEAADSILKLPEIDPDVKFKISSNNNVPAISLAIERGHYEMAKLLIGYGCSVNLVDDCGCTPLHFAVNNQNARLLKLLIANRANVNFISYFGQTPLHLAAAFSSVEICEELIKAGADIEKKDLEGKTALAISCLNNQPKIAQCLIKWKANVNSIDKMGNTPLLHAINCGLCLNFNLIPILLEAGADPNHANSLGQTALGVAVRRSSESSLNGQYTVRSLISHNCHINDKEAGPLGEVPIHLAISTCQDRIAEMLIRAGCDVNVKNYLGLTPLQRLVSEGKTELAKLIIASQTKVQSLEDIWVSKEALEKDSQNELKNIVNSGQRFHPSLKHIVRASLRRYLGRRADEIITQLDFPLLLKQYLLLLEF